MLDTSIDPPRPSSPWTPSYSVSVQGSPLPGTTELPQEDLPSAQDNFASELEAEKETTEIPSVQEPQKDDAISEETPANVAPPVEVATVVQVPTEKTSDVASQVQNSLYAQIYFIYLSVSIRLPLTPPRSKLLAISLDLLPRGRLRIRFQFKEVLFQVPPNWHQRSLQKISTLRVRLL